MILRDANLAWVLLGVALALLGVMVFGLRRTSRYAQRRERSLRHQLATSQTEIQRLMYEVKAQTRSDVKDAAKSRFLASISHELRTPLHGLLGMADLLSESTLTPEQRSYLEAIRTSGLALATQIDEILDFSRIEAGHLELAEAPFDIVALVEGTVELLAPRAQGKGLEIATCVGPQVPRHLVGDAARLRQVLLNVAGNAVKFTQIGGIGVRVDINSAGQLRFIVTDTGPGISADFQDSLFEDFEQASPTQGEGTGLGLAIARRVMAGMNGALNLDHSDQHGSVFSFTLPLRAAQTQDAPTPEAIKGRRILIIGQSPFEGPFLGERLAAGGAQVQRQYDEVGALKVLAQRPAPDVVIVDCAMGADATHRLAQAAHAARRRRGGPAI